MKYLIKQIFAYLFFHSTTSYFFVNVFARIRASK